jgi:lysophospholipase L1-like esterase
VKSAYDSGDASVQFLACQGATTSNITDFSLHGEGPQLDRMTSTVTHIFVSISGNDLNFASILSQCALVSAANCQPVADHARQVGIPAAIANMKQTLQKVHAKAPTAEIILTGYAPMVSSNSLFFTSSYGVLQDLALDFVAAQKAAVGVLDNTMNIHFADIQPAFAGHADGAPNNESWFFGFEFDSRTESKLSTRTLHPNEKGEVAIAKVVTTKVLKPFSCPSLVKSGATGDCVKQIQRSLNAWNAYTSKLSFATLTIDGDFGAKTLAAVKAFQTYRGLTSDGIVGPATKADLFDK